MKAAREGMGLAGWFLPSISDMVFVCLFVWALANGLGFIADGDTGWHIITGEQILKTFSVPTSDPYSYSMAGTPWTAHEWLAEIVFALFHRLAGINGVVVFSAAVVSLTFFWLYKYLLKKGAGTFTAVVLTVLAALASTLHWLARPHILSMPLTLAVFVILEDFQRDDKNRLWLLPPLMLLWVNLHGGYILGLILALVYAGCNITSWLYSGRLDYKALGRAKAVFIIFLLMLMAACINPSGPAILYFPFHLVGRAYIMDNIMEWLSPDFHKDKIFEFLLLTYASTLLLARKKVDLIEGVLLLFLAHMSLYSARYIPLFLLVATPIVAPRLTGIIEESGGRLPEKGLFGRVYRRVSMKSAAAAPFEERFRTHVWVYAALAASLVIAVSGGSLFGRQVFDYRHDKKITPVDAFEFVIKNGINGRMFNNDGWGGYIIYRGYPGYKVFFDGRSDMYGVPFLKEFIKVARAEKGFEEVLDRYRVDWVIYNANSPLCQILEAGGKWRLIYADKTADVLLRVTPQNMALIEKHKDVRFVPGDESK